MKENKKIVCFASVLMTFFPEISAPPVCMLSEKVEGKGEGVRNVGASQEDSKCS